MMLEGIHRHQAVLFSGIGQLLEQKRFLDVMLMCNNEAIMVHKLVLVAYSKYFDSVLLRHADRCPIINIDSLGIEFETLRAVISFMYKGTVDMTQCGIEAFDAALKSLQIDISTQLVSLEDELTKRHDLIQYNEGLMEDNFIIVKQEQVGNEVVLSDEQVSQSQELSTDLQQQHTSLIPQCHEESLPGKEQDVINPHCMEWTKREQIYSDDNVAAVETSAAIDKPISDREMANCNADKVLCEEQVNESLGTLQSDWNHAENITIEVVYSNMGVASNHLVTSDVGDVKLAEILEPVSSEKTLSPDYQAVSLLLNFKEQDRSVFLGNKCAAGLAQALPKLWAPTVPVTRSQCAVDRIMKEQSSETGKGYGMSLPQLDENRDKDFLRGLDTTTQAEPCQKSFQIIDSLEPVSGPEVEISSLAEVYTSSLSQSYNDIKLNDNPDENDNEEDKERFENSLKCKDQFPNDNSGGDCNEETAVKDEVDVDINSNSRPCTDVCVIKKTSGPKRTFQRCNPARSTKQLPAIKFPRLMLNKSKCKGQDRIRSACRSKQQLEFGNVLKNDYTSWLFSEDTSFYNGQQQTIYNKGRRDMWMMKDGFYTCKICHWRKRRPTTLLRHPMFHSREKPFVCEYSCKQFNTRQKLKEHIHTHRGQTCSCHHCGKVTTNKGNLNKHKKYKHISCSVPGCKFKASYYKMVQLHIDKDHSDQLPVNSLVYYAWLIQIQEKFHKKENLTCYKCNFNSKNLKRLYSHMWNVHDLQQYHTSGTYSEGTAVEDIVTRHIQCKYCTYLCLTREKMNNHLSQVHGDITERLSNNAALDWTDYDVMLGEESRAMSSYDDVISDQIEKILQSYRPLAPYPSFSSAESALPSADLKSGVKSVTTMGTAKNESGQNQGVFGQESSDADCARASVLPRVSRSTPDHSSVGNNKTEHIVPTYKPLTLSHIYDTDEQQSQKIEPPPSNAESTLMDNEYCDITETVPNPQLANNVNNADDFVDSGTHHNCTDPPVQTATSPKVVDSLPETEIIVDSSSEWQTDLKQHKTAKFIAELDASNSLGKRGTQENKVLNADQHSVKIKIVPSSRTLSASQTFKRFIPKSPELGIALDLKCGETSNDNRGMEHGGEMKSGSYSHECVKSASDSAENIVSRLIIDNCTDIRSTKRHCSADCKSQINLLLPVHQSENSPRASILKTSISDRKMSEIISTKNSKKRVIILKSK